MPEPPAILGLSLLPRPGQPPSAAGGPPQPRTALEQALTEIWQQVLPGPASGPEADFFSLGGDSLLAAQVVARARQVLGVALEVGDLLDHPTIGGLAARVELAWSNGRARPAPPMAPASRAGPLPLSFTQERLWFIHQVDPRSAAYHIARAAHLRGPLDLSALEAAFTELVRRHESLRTTFALVAGEPRQCPQAPTPFRLALAPAGSLAEAYALARQAARQPFDLAQGPLLRVSAYRLADHDHLLLLSLHHIISDGWSMGVLARELALLYRPAGGSGSAAGRPEPPPELPELPLQYADFAAWERAALPGAALDAELAFWRQKLQGVTPLALPLDHPRPDRHTDLGALETASLDPGVLRQLRRLGQHAGATLSMLLLAAFQLLLGRYSGQDDIAVGLPIANRREAALEGLIGAFINTLVLRTNLAGAANFRELLARVRQASLEAYAHPDLPFARLVAELNPGRDLGHAPLVQVMFNHLNVPMPSASLAGLEGDWATLDRGAAQFDLTLTVLDQPLTQQLRLEYRTDLFEAATARRMLGHYTHLLGAIAADPDQPLSGLPWLAGAEQRQLLVDWNDTQRPYPASGLAELFEQQVARAPDATALIFGDETLSYDALNQRANHLAHELHSQGVGPGAFVGVSLPRSFEQIAALLAVLKAGAAFVPLDPAYPPERLRDMLEDCGAKVVVDLTPHPPSLNGPGVPANSGDTIALLSPSLNGKGVPANSGDTIGLLPPSLKGRGAGGGRSSNLGLRAAPDDPAYMIYTSGSSGQPKGVLAPQRSAVNRVQWMWDAYPFQPGEVAACKTSLNFVDAIAEIFTPLLRGVPLLLIPDDVARDPARLAESLAAGSVTRLVLAPSLLRALLALPGRLGQRLPRLALIISSGEALDPALARACASELPAARLLNLYGSSEDGGDVCCFECRQPLPPGALPIGRPIANSQVYLLDPAGQPVPIGVTGEIYAGGAGVALGYHNRPELAAERFVPDPFSAQPGARLFRTGDLGRWLPDGNLLYLGRRDRQVKVRGVRVELDEVQSVLARHPLLAACAVRAYEREAGAGPELAAYYVPQPGASPTTGELRRHLARWLPEGLLPAWFVPLPALPLLPGGKLNLAALPDPDPRAERQRAGPRVAPRTPLEASLARLWAESLGLSDIGVNDNFFELGGHSLLAVRLFARLKASLGLDLPLALLYQAPTIQALAAAVVQGGPAPALLSSLAPLKPSGARPPLFCVHPLGGGVGAYAALAQHLHPRQPFYGLRAKGLDDDARQGDTVEALAADYLAEIRALQPSGPYRLAGYSSGGLIAFEMARQLAAAGQPVALLALLDSYAPRAGGAPGQARPRAEQGRALLNLAASLPHWAGDLARLEPEQILTRLRHWRLAARRGRAALTAGDYFGESALARLPERHRRFVENHFQAIARYAPQPYAGRVTLFRAQAQALSRAADPDKGWRALALGGVEIREFPGSHHTLLDEPWVAELAKVVQKKLDELADE